jgi:DNA mismatch repair protein MSH4
VTQVLCNPALIVVSLQRATSTHEGIAIAHAVSEWLIQRNVTTIFATHFVQLASTLSPYPNFASHHLVVSLTRLADASHSFSFQHRIASGVSSEEHHGLVLARDCQMPSELIEDAERMAKDLVQRAHLTQMQSNGMQTASRRGAIIELQQQLQGLPASTFSAPSDLRAQLLSIQNAFISSIDDNLAIYPETDRDDRDNDNNDPNDEDGDDSDFAFDEEQLAVTVNEMLSDFDAR